MMSSTWVVTSARGPAVSARLRKMTPGRTSDGLRPVPDRSLASASCAVNRPLSPFVRRPTTKSPEKKICLSDWVANKFSASRSGPAGMLNSRAS